MNIAIIGIGGVGGYFGGKLAAHSAKVREHKVSFIARGSHLEAIRAKGGLVLGTQAEGKIFCVPSLATADIEELPEPDLCLVCVKSYDLDSVLRRLGPKVKQDTRIIPLLNGVDIYERVRKRIDKGIVLPACAYIGTHIEKPGTVTQNGGVCEILFGTDPTHADCTPTDVFALFDAAGIKHGWLGSNPFAEIWKKFMFICAFGLATASYGKTLGEVMESVETSALVLSVMREIHAISKEKGIGLRESVITESFEKGRNFPGEAKTSFQRDFENADKKDERDLFGETVIRLGKEVGVDTPATRMLVQKLEEMKPWKNRG